MKLAKNRKVLVTISIVLALVIGASATFAWVTSKNQIANEFKNKGFSKGNGLVVSEEEEEFEWEEFGATEDKHVSIVNTGESPMLARVTFEEMIKLLGNDGKVTRSNSATPAAGMLRVPFNSASLTGWIEISAPSSGITFVPALSTAAPGVKVYKLGSVYKASYEYTEGSPPETKYQLVDFTGKLNPAGDTMTWDNTNADLTKRGVQYLYYTEGTAVFDSWNDEHNYEPWALPTPLFNPLTQIAGSPASPADSTVRPADVHFEYNTTDVVTSIAGALATYQNKWYYNAGDGYFYYMGVIPGGGSTPDLLEGVTLDGGADQLLWQKYEYTLVVCVEGLQANVEALTDTDATGAAAGWQLSNAALIAALTAVINA